jgi:hypothetical protein
MNDRRIKRPTMAHVQTRVAEGEHRSHNDADDWQVEAAYEQLVAQEAASFRLLSERRTFESLNKYGDQTNPSRGDKLISFTVPNGYMAEINGIAVVYSDPAQERFGSVGWRPIVDGGIFPNFDGIGGSAASSGYVYTGIGSLAQPMMIEPAYVRGNSVCEIELYTSATTHDTRLVITGRMTGRLWRMPTGG